MRTTPARALLWLASFPLLVSPQLACSEEPAAPPAQSATETQPAASEPVDPATFPDVVATVNGTEIRKQELVARAEAVKARMANVDPSRPDFYREILDQLIGAELLYQESRTRGLAPSAEEVEAQLGAIRARFPSEDVLAQQLAAEGLTLDDLRRVIEKDLAIQKLIETEIVPEATVTEEDKKAFYEENQDKLQQPEQVRLHHILIAVGAEASAEEKQAARAKAEALRERVVAGEDFATLARENSDDPGSKDKGGDLSWVPRGATVPPFEDAAFALEPGEVSDVVETRYGYHIIRLDERKEAATMPYDEVSAQIGQFLQQQAVQKAIEAEVERLRAAATIEIFI